MKNYICRTCGTQYAAVMTPLDSCTICEDERQYVGWNGQQWTTLAEMQAQGFRNELRSLEPRLFGSGPARGWPHHGTLKPARPVAA